MEKLSTIPSALYMLVAVMAIRQRYARRNIEIPSECRYYLLSPISYTCFLLQKHVPYIHVFCYRQSTRFPLINYIKMSLEHQIQKEKLQKHLSVFLSKEILFCFVILIKTAFLFIHSSSWILRLLYDYIISLFPFLPPNPVTKSSIYLCELMCMDTYFIHACLMRRQE